MVDIDPGLIDRRSVVTVAGVGLLASSGKGHAAPQLSGPLKLPETSWTDLSFEALHNSDVPTSVVRLRLSDRGQAVMINADDEDLRPSGEGLWWSSSNNGSRRWKIAPQFGRICVEWCGAIGDGTTDDIKAFQGAHDYCLLVHAVLALGPRNYFLSEKLLYQAVPIIGTGSGLTTVRGAPGNDILFFPDPSDATDEAFSRSTAIRWPENFLIEGVKFQLDGTRRPATLASRARPIYPIVGSRGSNQTVLQGEWYENLSGAIIRSRRDGRTGLVEPLWPTTPGTVADGSVEWEWVASAQVYVGNAAIAAPQADGSCNAYILGMMLRDIRIEQIGLPGENATVGCYLQRAPYRLLIDGLTCRFTFGGLLIVPPTQNFHKIEFAPDEPRLRSLQMFCTYSIVTFNLFAGCIEGATYCNNVAENGLHLFEYRSLNRQTTSSVIVLSHYAEGGSGQSNLFYVMGHSHTVISPYWSSNNLEQRAIISGDNIHVISPQILLTSKGFVILGKNNRLLSCNISVMDTIYDEHGINTIEISSVQSDDLHTERAVSVGLTRSSAFHRSAAFLRHGSGRSYFSDEDLLIGGRELSIVGGSPSYHTDLRLETGGFLRFSSSWYCQTANNVLWAIGTHTAPSRFPATHMRVLIKVRSNLPTQITLRMGVRDPEYVNLEKVTVSITEDWQSLELWNVDLSEHEGCNLQMDCTSLGVATSVDLAWIGFVVVPNSVPFPGGGRLFTEDGALMFRGASGTVTQIAPA